MKIKFIFLLALTICLAQISFAQDIPVNAQTSRGYLIGPGDKVTTKVLGEEQFDFIATVDEDGKIQVPFFNQGIVAKCRTEKELREDVAKLLSKYLKNPQISVAVTERNSRPPVTIYGEVKQQQQIVLHRQARLLELISFAGGVTEEAGGMIQIFRTQAPMCSEGATNDIVADSKDSLDVPSRMYSLTSLKQGRDESNPVIFPGDIIVVQKAAPVYFTGEVRQTTGLLLKEGGLSLTQAIAMVGGVNREAKTKDIKIYRLKTNSKDRDIISVNYDLIKKGEQKDVMLEPYDIVEVDKSKKSIAQVIFETVTGAAKTTLGGFGGILPQRILY